MITGYHKVNELIQYLSVGRGGKVIERLPGFFGVLRGIGHRARNAHAMYNPINYRANIFFRVHSAVHQLLHCINQGKCDHALTQVVTCWFSYSRLIFGIVEDVIDDLEGDTKIHTILIEPFDLLWSSLAYYRATFAAGSH